MHVPAQVTALTATLRLRDELRAEILDGDLAPGQRLTAAGLADRHGTSRTPVREALMLLARESLVRLEPHRGAVVSAFDPADLLDLYDLRARIEPHAAGLAATRIGERALMRLTQLCDEADARGARTRGDIEAHIASNEEFHSIVCEAAASPRTTAAMGTVAGIPRAFRTAFWRSTEQRAQSLFCHRELVSALRAHRPELAEAVMRMHIVGAREFLTEVVRDDAAG